MKKGTKIFLTIFIIALLIAVAVLAVFFLNKEDDEEESTRKKLKWGDVYLKILKDEENFDDLKDIKLRICDLNNDDYPELVVTGTKKINDKILTKIYSINKKEEVDTIQFELDDEYELEFLYNNEEDSYGWYAIVDDDEMYNIQIEEKNYEVERTDYEYDDFESISVPEVVDFDPEDDTPKEIIDALQEVYNPEVKSIYEENESDKNDKEENKETSKVQPEDKEKDDYEDDYGYGVGDADGSYMGYFYSFVQNYKENSYSGFPLVDSRYSESGDVNYLFFADIDLDDIPEMYVLSENSNNEQYNTRRTYLTYSDNGGVFDSSGPYMSDKIMLVKNEDGDYCYFESENDYVGKDYESGSDTSFTITNTKTKKFEAMSYRPQSEDSVPVKLEEMKVSDIMDYTKYNWNDITMEQFRKYAKEYKDEYQYSGEEDLIKKYRVELEELSDDAIVDAIPEAYSNYEKMMKKIK